MMNFQDLLFERRDYLLAYIDTRKIERDKLEKVKELIEKYNNGYVRYENFKSREWQKGVPENLEWKIIIFGVNGRDNINGLIKEASKYNIEMERYTETIE